jgi:predicted dehydrogenase
MTIGVAIIGYGTVGAIHAAKLGRMSDVQLVSVYGPKRQKALSFASTYGIPRACDNLAAAVSGADAAIICSPSPVHFMQARECLMHGLHTLIELPPCEHAPEAEELARLAQQCGVKLGCAHTSRFLGPYLRAKETITSGKLGEVQEINYIRCHKLRERTWTDNALLHHAAHPIDLTFFWCGGVEAKGCVAIPDVRSPHTVSVLGKLPSGGAVSITVTYASTIYQSRMIVVGEKHTIETDGFSYAKSDLPELEFSGDAQETYEEAIRLQDTEFLRACKGEDEFVGWQETVKVLGVIDQFRALGSDGAE